ncbi:MAG: hypothetical protein KAR39_12535 [Thermoplasmata archaeon]|nr:hypothetical protein [Thermoplasmata archaeon]
MAHGTLKDYVERLGLFPSYKAPKYLGQDVEFAYFEFKVPHAYRADNYKDLSCTLPEAWFLDMVSLPVHTGIEQLRRDQTFTYFKCKVPLCLMKSKHGVGYFAPQMQVSDELPPPSPDHVQDIDRAFEKAKNETYSEEQQWELTLRCNVIDDDGGVCGREVTEIHDTPTGGLVQRYCGKCQSTRLQLVSLKPIKPQDD